MIYGGFAFYKEQELCLLLSFSFFNFWLHSILGGNWARKRHEILITIVLFNSTGVQVAGMATGQYSGVCFISFSISPSECVRWAACPDVFWGSAFIYSAASLLFQRRRI